jgi:hypothetical protein
VKVVADKGCDIKFQKECDLCNLNEYERQNELAER